MDAGIQDNLKIVGEDVWLTVPPFSEYLRTVRLVAADAAVGPASTTTRSRTSASRSTSCAIS